MEQNGSAVPYRPARILVVDDQRYIARFLVYVLSEEGYEAQAAYDGEEALAAAAKFEPDAILLDLLLPKLSGEEVLARLRADPKFAGLKILLLTGCPIQEGDAREPLRNRADAYCLKPIGPSVLIGLLRKHGLTSQIAREAAPLH